MMLAFNIKRCVLKYHFFVSLITCKPETDALYMVHYDDFVS